ncbi:uncharacterized protein LOC34624425 [Cyclospora cayetanensis]|uniref:Uncharacterized protein LOC34624425 n=1 Tax=Cyclospora cayetanensis TaxID=88456 RepID=A0A6P6RZY0_9EIME|nr:uncharacterized protein LOC34624425 [Cyclospora cayetanensis]
MDRAAQLRGSSINTQQQPAQEKHEEDDEQEARGGGKEQSSAGLCSHHEEDAEAERQQQHPQEVEEGAEETPTKERLPSCTIPLACMPRGLEPLTVVDSGGRINPAPPATRLAAAKGGSFSSQTPKGCLCTVAVGTDGSPSTIQHTQPPHQHFVSSSTPSNLMSKSFLGNSLVYPLMPSLTTYALRGPSEKPPASGVLPKATASEGGQKPQRVAQTPTVGSTPQLPKQEAERQHWQKPAGRSASLYTRMLEERRLVVAQQTPASAAGPVGASSAAKSFCHRCSASPSHASPLAPAVSQRQHQEPNAHQRTGCSVPLSQPLTVLEAEAFAVAPAAAYAPSGDAAHAESCSPFARPKSLLDMPQSPQRRHCPANATGFVAYTAALAAKTTRFSLVTLPENHPKTSSWWRKRPATAARLAVPYDPPETRAAAIAMSTAAALRLSSSGRRSTLSKCYTSVNLAAIDAAIAASILGLLCATLDLTAVAVTLAAALSVSVAFVSCRPRGRHAGQLDHGVNSATVAVFPLLPQNPLVPCRHCEECLPRGAPGEARGGALRGYCGGSGGEPATDFLSQTLKASALCRRRDFSREAVFHAIFTQGRSPTGPFAGEPLEGYYPSWPCAGMRVQFCHPAACGDSKASSGEKASRAPRRPRCQCASPTRQPHRAEGPPVGTCGGATEHVSSSGSAHLEASAEASATLHVHPASEAPAASFATVAPPSSFAYRKATEEEILRTLPKPTPLSGPKGGAGQTASTRPASPSGAQEEEAEAFGSEAEEDFDSDGAFIEVSEGPYSIERANTASDNGGVDATASTTGHHGTKARASFLESMPGFDTYEVEESDSLEGPDYEANVGGSGMLLGTGVGAGGPRGLIVGHNEKRIFSLAPSGVVGDVSNCHVDHKGYTRIQVGVVVSWKDSQLPQPFVFGTFGPEAGRGSSRFSEKGEYEAEGDAALEDWGGDGQGGFVEIASASGDGGGGGGRTRGNRSVLAAALPPSVGALASESDENTRLVAEGAADRTPSYLASFSQLSVGFIKRFFKKGDDDFADDEGGDGGDDEGEGRKRGGFFKKFLRRKSRDAQDDYEGNGEEGEGDMYENERGFGSRRGGRSKRRGMKKFGKKIKSIAKASEALLAGSGTGGASSASVEMSFDFSSPAAPKCGVPAVWKGRLRLSSLVRVSFNVRVLLAEVEGAFADFVSSAVALEIRCKERRGCTLEDSLISCVQVSCPKRRELKASLKGHLDAHAQAANEQLQKVAEVLKRGGGADHLGSKDREQIAKAYAERIRQQQESKLQQERQQQQQILQQIHLHQRLAMQRQQQLLLQRQQQQPQRPGAPQTVYNQEEEPPQEEDEQPLESPKEEPPPKKRAKVTLVLAGGVSEFYASCFNPWIVAYLRFLAPPARHGGVACRESSPATAPHRYMGAYLGSCCDCYLTAVRRIRHRRRIESAAKEDSEAGKGLGDAAFESPTGDKGPAGGGIRVWGSVPMLRSLSSRISQRVWSTVHFRVGGRGQVRTNKGFKPQAFDSLGDALFFARWSKHLRAATVGNFVKANVSPQAATGIPNGAVFVRQIESGEVTPSLECQRQLEKILGVPVTPPKRKRRAKL